MQDKNRRDLLKTGGAVVAAGLLGGLAARTASADHEGHGSPPGKAGVAAVILPADSTGICATCDFWGGQRRVMDDGKIVYGESLGWCNNPDSHHFQTLTGPQTGPMKSWTKWGAV